MCKPASFIVTKDAVLWSKTSEGHEDIIKEFGLHADGVRGPNICRVELVPSDGLYYTDPATWAFKTDQDILPQWWNEEDGKRRSLAAAIHWQASKIIKPGEERSVSAGEFILFNYGTVQAVCSGGTVQEVYFGGTVREVCSGGTVQAVCSGGTVQVVLGGGTVREVCFGGTVREVCSGGTVQAVCSGGTVQVVLGGGTVREVCFGGTVREVCSGGTVQKVYGTIRAYRN
jgi:hypothetical protein